MPKKFTAKLADLHFDPANPRLIGDFEDDQDKMFRYLITDIGVDDLLESISASGLFNADPIIVRDRPKGGYFVIEGNRRLAAMKLLSGQRPDDADPIPTVPEVSAELVKKFDELPVESGWPDELLQAYLGYKAQTQQSCHQPPSGKQQTEIPDVFETEMSLQNEHFVKSLGASVAEIQDP